MPSVSKQFECFRDILIITFAKTTKLILKGKELACFCKNRPFSRREQHTCTKIFPIFLWWIVDITIETKKTVVIRLPVRPDQDPVPRQVLQWTTKQISNDIFFMSNYCLANFEFKKFSFCDKASVHIYVSLRLLAIFSLIFLENCASFPFRKNC